MNINNANTNFFEETQTKKIENNNININEYKNKTKNLLLDDHSKDDNKEIKNKEKEEESPLIKQKGIIF